MDNLLNFQIARFIGGENAGEELRSDSAGWFVSSLEVGTIQADSGDKYECSPSPGSSATANVHVITEGENTYLNSIMMTLFPPINYLSISWPPSPTPSPLLMIELNIQGRC